MRYPNLIVPLYPMHNNCTCKICNFTYGEITLYSNIVRSKGLRHSFCKNYAALCSMLLIKYISLNIELKTGC